MSSFKPGGTMGKFWLEGDNGAHTLPHTHLKAYVHKAATGPGDWTRMNLAGLALFGAAGVA